MARTYFKATPQVQADIVLAKTALPLASYTDIATQTGYPERTVRYVLVDLPRLRRMGNGDEKMAGSLKARIMDCLQTVGEVKDIAELRRILGMADTEHDVLHVLHSLHTQGKLDFTERGNGMGNATVVNIHLPKKGGRNGKHVTAKDIKRVADETSAAAENPLRLDNLDGTTSVTVTDTGEEAEPEATAEEVTQPQSESAPEPETEGYPLLDALMKRERYRTERDAKALAYLQAAEALEQVDPDAARELTNKADSFNVEFPSPIEREYIDYARRHGPEAGNEA